MALSKNSYIKFIAYPLILIFIILQDIIYNNTLMKSDFKIVNYLFQHQILLNICLFLIAYVMFAIFIKDLLLNIYGYYKIANILLAISFLLFITLLINTLYDSNKQNIGKYKIEKIILTATGKTSNAPSVYININGNDREITIRDFDYNQIKHKKYIIITTTNGLLGWKVIKNISFE